jgi:hypothetical protein
MARSTKKTIAKRRTLPKVYAESSAKVRTLWELGERMRLASLDTFDAAEFMHSTDTRMLERVADVKKIDVKIQGLYKAEGGPAFWSAADRGQLVDGFPDKYNSTVLDDGLDDDLDVGDLMSPGDQGNGMTLGSSGSTSSTAQHASDTTGGEGVGGGDTTVTSNAADGDKLKKPKGTRAKGTAPKKGVQPQQE